MLTDTFQNNLNFYHEQELSLEILLLLLLLFLAVTCGLRDLTSLTRDWTWALVVKAPRPNHRTARKFPKF